MNEKETIPEKSTNSSIPSQSMTGNETSVAHNDKPVVRDKAPLVQNETNLVRNEELLVRNETPLPRYQTPLVRNEEPVVRNEQPAFRNERRNSDSSPRRRPERSLLDCDLVKVAKHNIYLPLPGERVDGNCYFGGLLYWEMDW